MTPTVQGNCPTPGGQDKHSQAGAQKESWSPSVGGRGVGERY